MCGILGLPNVGKTTLFNALTKIGAEAANYPFSTIEPNVGVVELKDERLDRLAEMVKPKKITYTSVKFVDIAGLAKGANRGEGLGNKFLSYIREVDALVHVVRCFAGEGEDAEADPAGDIEAINTELILADLETVDKKCERLRKQAKGGEKKIIDELHFWEKIGAWLGEEKPVRGLDLTEEEEQWLKLQPLLTSKPVMYVANISEENLSGNGENKAAAIVKEIARQEGAEVVEVAAKIEAELAQLDDEEAALFLAELGLEESGLNRVAKTAYRLLGLITFITAGEPEVRAWTITRGTKAPQAAGKIHSDIERGFIRAEVVAYQDLINAGSYAAAREKGLIRLEGKEYVMKDGDVVHFRFNV
jgi:hypothetical protein